MSVRKVTPRDPFIRSLALMQQQCEANMKFAGLPRGTLRGTVVDVNDPEKRGRVRVIFDDMNPDCPQVSGAAEWSEERIGSEPDVSHWIDTSPAFKGCQPKGLVGKRVNIVASNGQYQYAVLLDVLYDPQLLATSKQEKLKMPNNSSMTRLPVYEPDEIPDPSEENHGCLIVENNGPMDGDWICVCVKRDGKYYWVRLSDLAHGHAGGNDGTQQVDSMGNRQNPVMMGAISDNVFPTTHQQMRVYSAYSTKLPGNPKGQTARWHAAPKSGDVYKPGSDFPLLSPLPDISLNAVRLPAGFSDLTQSIQGFSPTFDLPIPTVFGDAAAAVEKAQKVAEQVASAVNTAQAIASDPTAAASAATGFVSGEALSVAEGAQEGLVIPPATAAAIGELQNAAGTLNVQLPVPSIKSLPSLVASALKNVFGFLG